MRHIRAEWLIVAVLAAASLWAQSDVSDLIRRAVQFQQSGDYASAAELYRAVLKQQPEDVATHVNLGVALVHLGQFEEAIAEYGAAAKLLPGDPRIELNLALAYEKSGRVREAVERFEMLHKAVPKDNQVTMLLADGHLQLGEDARTIEVLEPLEAQAPEDLGVAYMLGMALLHEQRIAEGQALLDRILRQGNSAEARYLLGTRMFEAGDYPAAVTELASAIEVNDKLAGLESLQGRALLNTGDADGALNAFRKELAGNGNDYAANLGIGQILTVRKQYAEAQGYLRRALQVRADSPETKLALAECLKGLGKFGEARAYAAEAGKAMPAAAERPKVNEGAPDFSLQEAGSNRMVRLRDFHGKTPVVVVFGSYTCPNFRGSAETLRKMQERYGPRVVFLLVYIREAHDTSQWQSTRNEREQIRMAPAATLAQKQNDAMVCSRKLHLPFRALVDGMDNAVEMVYHAWPSRVFVIGADGRILYSSHLTELDFHADQMEAVLQGLVQREPAARQ